MAKKKSPKKESPKKESPKKDVKIDKKKVLSYQDAVDNAHPLIKKALEAEYKKKGLL
jgi:hypothetical protein